MRRCSISYLPVEENQYYAPAGLKRLSTRLLSLAPLPTQEEQHQLMSLNKDSRLFGKLKVTEGYLSLTNQEGRYLIKPQSPEHKFYPENESISTLLAAFLGIDVPVCGLLHCIDNTRSFFIKRLNQTNKDLLETKNVSEFSSHTQNPEIFNTLISLAAIIKHYATFPVLESIKLFDRTIFNFLIGNDDMKLNDVAFIKNQQKIILAPAYNLCNTVILKNTPRETTLTRENLVNDFATKILGLNKRVIEKSLARFNRAIPFWKKYLRISFLPDEMKRAYAETLQQRREILQA